MMSIESCWGGCRTQQADLDVLYLEGTVILLPQIGSAAGAALFGYHRFCVSFALKSLHSSL